MRPAPFGYLLGYSSSSEQCRTRPNFCDTTAASSAEKTHAKLLQNIRLLPKFCKQLLCNKFRIRLLLLPFFVNLKLTCRRCTRNAADKNRQAQKATPKRISNVRGVVECKRTNFDLQATQTV